MTQNNNKNLLKNYKVLESFVQCDFLDGFQYIDKAGEIVNGFVRANKEIPKFSMGLNGLLITNLNDTVKELRVSSNSIWIHFVEPKNLGDVSNEAKLYTEKIIKILKPTMFTRLGWRNYFIREDFSKNDKPQTKLKISDDLDLFDLQEVVLSKKIDTYDIRVEIGSVAKVTDLSSRGLLFDIDISKALKTLTIGPLLDDMRSKIKSDDLLDGLERLLK